MGMQLEIFEGFQGNFVPSLYYDGLEEDKMLVKCPKCKAFVDINGLLAFESIDCLHCQEELFLIYGRLWTISETEKLKKKYLKGGKR